MLRVNNLSKTYEDGTEALRGVSFSAESGDFIVILGKRHPPKSFSSILIGF
jgi:ABC-type Na+ transport system ATPase subunit NatA